MVNAYCAVAQVKNLTYSFLHNSFCDSVYVDSKGKSFCKRSDKSYPQFQIHEKSDIILRIVDVNPFLYSVKQATLQTDQIDNKILSEKNWGKELKLDFKPIESLSIDQQLGLSELPSPKIAALIDSSQLISDLLLGMDSFDRLKARIADKESIVKNLNEEITNLTRRLEVDKRNLTMEVATLNEQIKRSKIKLNQSNSKLQSLQKILNDSTKSTKNNDEKSKLEIDVIELRNNKDSLTFELEDLGRKVNEANAKKASNESNLVNRYKEDLETENRLLAQVKQQVVDRKTLEIELRILNNKIREKNDPTFKEGLLLRSIERLQRDVLVLNKFISLHNNLITVVHLPTNDYRIIAKKIDSLFVDILGINRGSIDRFYTALHDSIEMQTMTAYASINELKRLNNASGSAYDLVSERISSFRNSLSKIDVSRLIRQIKFMIEMVTDENFQLTPMKLYSYSDNVDLIRYHIELNPYNLPGDLPQGKTHEPLDFLVYLQGGVKFDVSSGFVMDLGLRDPSFYFERPTDSTAFVRQSDGRGNYNPSIALFLNGYRRSGGTFKLGGSFGTGISNNGRIRIYLGPSFLIGRSERITFSAGLALGAISRLGNGYKVDEQINGVSNLPTEVPTVLDRYKLGYYFGLGFNLTGDRNRKFIESVKFN